MDENLKNYINTLEEKAASQSQQRFMAMALAYKRGELDGPASPEVKSLAAKMSEKDLEDFAKTKHKGLPDKVETDEEYVPMKESRLSHLKEMISSRSSDYSLADVQKAVRLADKFGNNMTAATTAIEKIAKGLSNHPTVKRELRKMNEASIPAGVKGKESFVIKHKQTKKVLSTHSNRDDAKDEWDGLGSDKVNYGIYPTTGKAKSWQMKENLIAEASIRTMDGDVLKVGDFAGFKDDIEQSGKVVKIQGNTVTLSIWDSVAGERYERKFLGRELWKE